METLGPPSCSVIIPTYNRRDWVIEAVQSVLCQSCVPLEILVVDDGSTDDTLDALDSLPVKLISQKNEGPSSARNHGAREAKGAWLAFLDSDDLWEPDKLLKQMTYALEKPECELIHTGESWMRHGKLVKQKRHHRKEGTWLYRRSLERCLISPSSVVIRKTLFEKLGGFDEDLPAAEDYDLWLRICHAHPVGFLEEPLTVKRGGHSDQLSIQPGLDRYRAKALEKMMANSDLKGEDRELTRANLLERYRRLALGYRKHHRPEASFFEDRMEFWTANP